MCLDFHILPYALILNISKTVTTDIGSALLILQGLCENLKQIKLDTLTNVYVAKVNLKTFKVKNQRPILLIVNYKNEVYNFDLFTSNGLQSG